MSESAEIVGPTRTYEGGVAVAYREFALQVVDGSIADGQRVYGAGMLSARTNQLGIAVAVDPGVARLRIEMWGGEPPIEALSDWDAAAEIAADFADTAGILTALYAAPSDVRGELDSFELSPDTYRVRAFGRERGRHPVPKTEADLENDLTYDPDDPDFDTNKYPEEILLQIWQAPDSDDAATVLKDDPRYIAT